MEREGVPGRLRAPWLRAWLTAGLAAWALLGVLLVNRANARGLIEDIAFSPYHLVGYAALLVLAAYVAWAFFRSLRRGRWRQAFPPLYGGLGLGFLVLVGWVVLDPIWRDTLGINQSIEGGLAPTRLLIPLGLGLLATGPVREAVALRRRHGLQPAERYVRWAGVVSAGLLGASLTLVAFNPIQNPVSDWSFHPAIDNSEIWVMDADGSNQTRLLQATGGGIDYSLPAWSADGSRIAYTTWTNDDGGPQNLLLTGQTASIWTMAPDGSGPQALITLDDTDAWIPAWSPDGAWLAYTVTPHATAAAGAAQPQANPGPGQVGPPSGAPAGSSIWLVKADGTGARRLTPEGIDASGPAWSPDGTHLAFVAASTNAEPDIHVAAITDAGLTEERVLAAERGVDWGAAWSPDGTQIAFVSDRTADEEIWIVPADGSADARRLTEAAGGDWVPAFSPDGKRIAFVSERAGQPDVWDMAIDGSDTRNLTNQPWHVDGTWSVAYSPDGSRIAYASQAFQDPVNSGWVREDLAAAQAVLFGLALTVLALVLVAMGAPFGACTIALTIVVAAGAVQQDAWRYLVAAVGAGLVVDGLVAAARPRWRSRVAAAALPGVANVALAATIAVAGTQTWSWTLVLGVGLLSGVLGWALAEAVERLLQHPAPAAGGPSPASEAPAR